MCDFDDLPEIPHGEYDLEEDDPEIHRKIKASIQDLNDGFFYTMMFDEAGDRDMRCNKCQSVGTLGDKVFPHKYNCPMKKV